MDPATISTIAQVGGSVLGGVFGKKKKGPDLDDQSAAMHRDRKKIWRDEIPDRVAAAKRAGIHPLFALGASTTQPSGFTVGGDSLSSGEMYSDMGQNIGRAVGAALTGGDRQQVVMNDLQIENQSLQNDILRQQIARMSAPGTPPPMPGLGGNSFMPGQGVEVVPNKVTHGGSVESGMSPFEQIGLFNGRKVRMPGDVFSDASLDDGPATWYYQLTRTVPDMVSADNANFWANLAAMRRRSMADPRPWYRKPFLKSRYSN